LCNIAFIAYHHSKWLRYSILYNINPFISC